MVEKKAPQDKPGWKFDASNNEPVEQILAQDQPKQPAEITWSASEYVHHEKGIGWFLVYFLASVVIIGLVFLLTRDLISVIVLGVLAIGFGFFAGRQPQTLNYSIDGSGLHIGSRSYPVANFKSFAIIQEGGIKSISLQPLMRFMPAITIYFAPEDETKIVEALGLLLPQEEKRQDAVDRLMHKIRF